MLSYATSRPQGALIFPGFGGGAGKAREKHPGQESWPGTRLCFAVRVRVRLLTPTPRFTDTKQVSDGQLLYDFACSSKG